MDSFGLKIKESFIFDVHIGFFGFVFAIDGGLSCDDFGGFHFSCAVRGG